MESIINFFSVYGTYFLWGVPLYCCLGSVTATILDEMNFVYSNKWLMVAFFVWPLFVGFLVLIYLPVEIGMLIGGLISKMGK